MKIGIITFHRVNNYGAVLQAYALQRTLMKLGCECEIIDYGRDNWKDILQWQKNKVRCLFAGKPDRQGYSNLEFLNMVFHTVFFNKKEVVRKFSAFRRELTLSRPVGSSEVKELNGEYDLFLSGSDQVWNCGRVNLDKNYFLDFVRDGRKKGSYAASFGIGEIPDKYKEEYRRMLADYRYLAVREEAGAKIIKKLIQREAKTVLDPTLLLDKEEWYERLGKAPKQEPVIVVYMLEYSRTLLNFAYDLSKRTGCSLLLLNRLHGHRIAMEAREDVGPLEWLKEIQNASYVVTNSFHGVAFSINFNKEFYVEIARERIRGAMSSRIEHILYNFRLEDHLINTLPKKFDLEEYRIDYGRVNGLLANMKEESLRYLQDMIEETRRDRRNKT